MNNSVIQHYYAELPYDFGGLQAFCAGSDLSAIASARELHPGDETV